MFCWKTKRIWVLHHQQVHCLSKHHSFMDFANEKESGSQMSYIGGLHQQTNASFMGFMDLANKRINTHSSGENLWQFSCQIQFQMQRWKSNETLSCCETWLNCLTAETPFLWLLYGTEYLKNLLFFLFLHIRQPRDMNGDKLQKLYKLQITIQNWSEKLPSDMSTLDHQSKKVGSQQAFHT